MDYGIMFFSSGAGPENGDPYRLLTEATRFADQNGFCCVWTPERHFNAFGGLFPNPSVTSAALATMTERVQLRAGSLISPLHHPVRIAEEWSVVDNLSKGRVAISFGSGWNINDFIFFPEHYAERQKVMYQQIETVRTLWRGGTILQKNARGKDVEIALCPKPVQNELPVWVTSSGNIETFKSAGKTGAGILTHLIGQDIATLGEKIQVYRDALREQGFEPDHGKVSLMLHTFMGADVAVVKDKVRIPFREYLRSAVKLEVEAAKGGGTISGGHEVDPHEIGERDMDDLLEVTFNRYFHTGALMGTPESCRRIVEDLREIGVDEIACLIDFIDDADAVLESLVHLDRLRRETSCEMLAVQTGHAVNAFMEDLE